MCGRFVSATPPDQIAQYFDATTAEALLEPSYNVAPTNDVYAVTEDGTTRRVDAFHWGLVPSWAKDPKIGSRMINARAETLATKNAFRSSFRRRRCIVPVDGFYEWRTVPGQRRKQPVYIHRPDGEPLAFAGLWSVWQRDGDTGPPLRSCTIVTTTANETLAPVHDRMPVILPPSRWDEWLDPANDDTETLGRLLVPAPSTLVTFHPVSTDVNHVRNKGAELILPVDPDPPAAAEPVGLFG